MPLLLPFLALAGCLLGGCIIGNDATTSHRTTVGQQLLDLAEQRRQGQLSHDDYMQARFRVLDHIDDGPLPDSTEVRYGGASHDPATDATPRNRDEATR